MAAGVPLRQFGVLAYRRGDGEELSFLLITSRDTGRWVVPRGNAMNGLKPHKSAMREAWEEAGLVGSIGPEAIGTYSYGKRQADGSVIAAEVTLFPLHGARQRRHWPERSQRETRWFPREEAAAAVDEHGLKAIILGFTATA